MSGYNPDFDWPTADAEGLIVQQSVERVAIYTNPNGDLVIRQERRWDEEDDIFVVIARGNAEAAIAEMQFAIGQPAQPGPLPLPAPKDRTAAERQKRRRAKQRDDRDTDRDMGVTVTGDTDLDTAREGSRLVAAE